MFRMEWLKLSITQASKSYSRLSMTRIIVSCLMAVVGALSACDSPETRAGTSAGALTGTAVAPDITLDELLTNHQAYERIPLKKMSSGHLQMRVLLNGVAGNFILDTGAGATVLEEKRKATYHIKSVKSDKEATGTGGGAINMQLSAGNNLQIGQLEIENSSIYLMSLDHVNRAFKTMKMEEVDGIIGADILSSKKGVIDYPNLILYLQK